MSIISDSMLRNNDSDRASAQYASSQPYSQTYSDEGSSSDNQQGLLERIFNGLGAASDWIGNNVEYVENSPVGQWIGNNVECVENSPVGQAVGQVGQVLAPANSIFRNWPALLGLAANAAVTPKDNDTFSGSLYDAGVNGAANTVGSIADLMHQDDLAAAMYTLANKTQDNTPVQADWDWDYITNPHGLTRSFGNAIGSMAPLLPAAALAPESLVAAAGRLSPWLANGVRYGFTAIPEAMAEGGQTRREAIEDGLNHPDLRAFGTLAKNLPLLAVSNTLEGAILGGGLGKMLAGKAGEGVLSRVAKAPFRATPSALAEGLQNGLEEGLQQGIQNASVDKEYGYLPWNWTDDQWDAAKEGFFGTLPLGGIGGARKAIFPGVGGVATAPENGPDNTDPVVMAQLTGKNDDVPTADGVDVTELDPQQYTQWYGEKLKSQGIDVPDATITVQTPKATGTTGGAKAGAGANVMDAAQDFMGQHMENGANGCVEAVTKIGARYNPFLADELSKGVVNVDTLVADAGDKVIPFDPNNLEAGDVIVYGDNDHVVLADGNGGYVGNSSSQQKVVQGGNYNEMGDLKPTKIIKTGNGVTAQNETANNGGASAADLSSLPVGDIATAIAQNTGLPANFIWAQLSHESDGGNSKLAREDHNYGGVKGNDGEYLHFDNDQQFIDYMSDYYPKYREDGIYDAQTADQFAEALQHGGYFTAGIDEYEGGMHRYLEQAGLSDSGTAGAPSEKQSGGNANTMTQQQFGDMLNEKMIDFAGTNDDTVKAVFNDMSTSKDKALVSLFAPYMQDGVFANTAANRTALVNNDGFKKAMSMFLSKHLSDYAPAFDNGRISFRQAEDALRPRHQVQAAQTAQAPNIQTVASPKMEAAAIQNVLSSFAQDKKNVARTEQEANLFDDMLDADDHFIDTPKNRQTLLKNYGAQLQNYVDDVMTPSLDDRVNQAIEQAIQNKDLNRMNILTQAKQANDTAALEKLVGLQTKQHVDIAAMLTPANTDVKNHVSSMMQGNALVHQTTTMEHQAPQNEVASTVQGNTPVQQAPATENEMPQGKVAPTIQANMPVNQAPARMDNQQAAQQDAPKEQVSVTPLPTQKGQQSEGVRIAQPQQTIDEQNAQTDARIAEIKKTPLAQRKALGQQYLDTLRQNNVSFSEKKLAKSLMNGDPEALEHVQRTYGDLLNTITPAEAAAASQHAPRTIQAATTARLGNMVSEITSGNTYKNASPVGKLAYLSAASAHAKTVGADKSARAIDSIIADVRKKAGFSGKGTTEGMTPEQKDEFYNAFYKQSLDDATAIRKEATDENPANLKSLDNTIEVFKQELAKSKPTKEERKEVTHESTQSKSQNEPDKGTKNQDQHAKPEPRKTADTQREAEESEVSTTKKAADNDGKYVLADGYRTESGKPLLESGENEFILKPNGSKDFGEITDAISKAAKEQSGVDLAPGKIRLRVGNDKEGLLHAKKHEEQANAAGYDSTENMVADIAESFDEIYMREPVGSKTKPTFVLVKHNDRQSGKKNGIAPAYFELKQGADGNFYIVVTAIPMRDRSLKSATKKDRLIYSSPALGAASTSSSSTVSRPRSDNAGATKGVRPTSDKSSGLSTHIIPHEQKEGTKNLDAGKVPGGLSKEAQEVYIAVRDKLHTSKSKARRAADVSAEILARHADTYAKAYSKATGKKYTAADYMRDKIGIDTDGNVVNDEKAKQFFQKAWHGSPHDFDRFDLGAIGTGEGAQVHGWGLYFAANREVSEGYIERLSDVIGHEIAKDGSIVQKSDEEWATIDNAPIDENTPPLVIALKLLREVRAKGDYNIGDAIQKLQWQYIQRMEDDIVASDFLTKWYKKFKYRNTLKNLKAAEQILKEGKYDFKNITSGHLFEVEIPEADTMLDEQLSYSEQPKMVQKAIDALYADRKKLAKEWKNLSAEDFKEIYHPSGEAWTYFMEWNRLRSLNWAFNAFTREDIGNFLRETSSKNHYPESKIREIENSEQAYNKARNDVRHALANTESYLSKMVERVGVSEDYHDMNGREIYQDYMNALMMYHNISRGWASKNTALALREHGVNGVSYVGGRDGRCYVTFDDKTVKIINKYNQMLNGAAQGYTSALSDGKRVVTLLDGADESTFLHEMGHVFLLDLQDLAEIDQTSANDMSAVESWATWKNGQAKDYKGTAWEQEFADREKAIAKAMADGDEATASQLKDEWMQERFARGLERYLESGEAPSSKLESVFEKFRKFLTRIYNAFKDAGGKPSEDVKNVMARMMDSDVENTIKVPEMGEPIHGIKAAERVARNGTTAASLFGNEEGSHVDVARSKASVQGDLKKIGKRVVFLPDNSLTSREKGIKEFGEKMGLKVVFFEGPSNLHGMYENGVSFINRSSSTSAPWTFWHETFHWLRHNNPELYRQMVSYIGKKQAFSSEQLQAYRDKTGRQALSEADVIEEMLADAMPDVHKRVSLFRNLGKADAPLLQRFVGWLRDAMRAFHDALTGRKAGLSETQKAAMRDALANIAADLRDSNGKHIFKVSGAEREITAADGTKLSYPARFSGKQETPTIFTAEDRLKADKKAWKGTLRKAWKGDMPDTTMLPVMQTPLVLKLVGAPDYPMVMRQSKLMKIKKDHPEVTKAILNELPSYLADPMIIFKSSTVSGRLVVGTELEDASGANIIVPIELNSKDGRMDVNVITSVYGKGTQQSGTNIAWFVNNIQAGNAVYINKKQAADFYQSAGLQLPMEGRRFNDLFGSSIKTDADLVKSRRENPVRYSLDANDNSTPSLFTRAYNHLTGRKNAASHDKNVKAMLEDITKMRIRFGKLDPKTETVFKKFEGVIRARNANEWEKVLPEAGRAIADRLNLKPSEDMNNYIAKWLLDEATNDTSQEASDFAAALKNDPVLSDQLVDLKTLFNERNNREADEVVRDAIQYEKPKERTTLTKAWETFYDEMIEELGPVKRMVKRVQEKSGQELAASVNPYIALRLFRGNAGRAMTMIEGQSEVAVKALQTNYPGVNFNGFKTLHMILDECGALHNEKRMKDFLAFALACHVKDIHTLNNRIRKSQQRLRDKIADLNDKINNLPEYQQLIESDKKVDDKYQEQREAYQKEIEGYQAKIDKAEKTIMEVPRTEDGLSLTEDRCNKVMMKYMKEYGEAQQDLVHFSKVTTSILYDAGVISKKRYKELQERWPNYIPMFRVFEDNEEVDFGDSLKPMHGSTRRIINPLDSIIRNTYDFVKKAERNKARQLLADLTRISDVGEYIEEVDNLKPNDKTTITFYENGERKYLQTDPDIVKAVNNMGREESNWVLRLLHGPAKIARACFTTINPSFALRNLIRDSTDATIYSKYGFKPWDFVRGFLHAVHRDELFYEWLSSGAAQASAISLDRDYTQATLNQMSKTWKERLLSKEFLPAILEGMQMVGEYSEYGTRIAAYERAKKKLAGENGPHPAAYDLASAALESRDLMDFARGGRGSRYLNNVVVFANASIQGFDKFFRTFDFRKPYRKESMKALARLFLCGMLPALLLAGIHSGDDWWEELPDWQKETNWILGKVGNTIIRIPKGQDIGLRFFSNLIEKAMDRSKHKAGDYFKPVWDSLPDMIPTALLPIIEATANHSYFTGAPVVPKYQEKLPAYLQFGNETSSFAKFVGKVIGVSPRKVEHVLFGYTGNMGKGLLGVYDTIVGNQSLNTNLNEAPVISGFTAIPYKQSKTVNDFYDKFDEQQRLNEEFKLTKKKPDGYDPSLYKRMTKAQQELSKINKQERAAIDDPKMDSGVREQKQLGYQQQRLSVVRRVMGQ